MKKILSILIAAAILLTSVCATCFASGEESDAIIEIATAEALGAITMNGNYIITDDITLGDGWVPLGNLSAPFTGTLYGEKADGTTPVITLSGTPLFGYCKGADISFIHTAGTVTTGINTANSDAAGSTAGIAAIAENSVFTGCENSADITLSERFTKIGGIAGKSVNTSFISCSNSGDIKATASTTTSYYIGGIVGYADDKLEISKCRTSGLYSSVYWMMSAGLCGAHSTTTTSADTISITESYSTATISGNGNKSESAGLISNAKSVNITIKNNYFAGKLSSNYTKAGLVHTLGGDNTKAGTKAVNVDVSNNYFAGEIANASNEPAYVVKKITKADYVTPASFVYEKNYYIPGKLDLAAGIITLDGALKNEAPVAKTAAELQDLAALGFEESIWEVNPTFSYAYPTLKRNPVIYGEGSKENPVKISTAEDFAKLASANEGEYYELTSDISLGERTPFDFKGVLNGNGKTINLGENAVNGVFASLSGKFEIYNINIEGKITSAGADGALAKSVTAGSAGKLEGINNYADVHGNGSAGGFIATAEGKVNLTNCINYGNVTAEAKSGISVSGFFGNTSDVVTFEKCANFGNVTRGANNNYTAGFVGKNSKAGLSFNKCYNAGNITVGSYGSAFVAHSTQAFSATDCYNAGSQNGSAATSGAFIGFPQYGVITLTNCYTVTGALAGNNSSYATKYAFTNCYIVAESAPETYAGVIATTREGLAEAKLGASFTVLNNWELPQLVDYPHLFEKGTEGNPVLISTAEDFAKMKDSNLCYALDADITLDGAEAFEFAGSLDGKNHFIKLLNHKGNGLFSNLTGNFSISNLVIEGSISAENGDAGALAGTATSVAKGTVKNVTNNATVTAKKGRAGGIFGSATSGSITYTKVVNNAAIAASSECGGLIGRVDGAVITGCSNNGAVKGNYAGGIAGVISGNNNADVTIDLTYNTGTITSKYAGGIVGWLANKTIITNCYNLGYIKSGYAVNGGITSIPQYQKGSVIKNCYSVVTVDGGNYISPASYENVDYKEFITLENCYYLSENNKDDGYEGSTAKTREEFAELALFLGMEWIDGEETSPFPQLESNQREGDFSLVRLYVSCGENGAATFEGERFFVPGEELKINVSGDDGFRPLSVLKNGEEIKDTLVEGAFTFILNEDVEINVTFEEIPVTAPSVSTFDKVWYENDGSITFGIITQGYKTAVKEFGIAYSEDKAVLEGWKGNEAEGVSIFKSRLAELDAPYFGIFLRGDILSGKTYYTRAYLIYEDEEGNTGISFGSVNENIISK